MNIGENMAKKKKDGVNINYYIRRDVKEKLDLYCKDVGQTATMAIERILDDYLTKYIENRNDNSGINTHSLISANIQK